MQSDDGQHSASGVWIAHDFRSNLIIDRYDPVFAAMRGGKLTHLRSANSEDAVTWNVFRSLRQIAPETWLPPLWRRAFPETALPEDRGATVNLWQSVSPPRRLLAGGDEGASEVDVVIETASWVWFIEAKYRSDISKRTKTRPLRDQILRNLDVGTAHARRRRFFFSLLIVSAQRSPVGVEKIQKYTDFAVVRQALAAHRRDGLTNLGAVGRMTWGQLAEVLAEAETTASREDERAYAARALAWLTQRVL